MLLAACKQPQSPARLGVAHKAPAHPTPVSATSPAAALERPRKPPGESVEASGTILVDGGYAVGSGAARLLSNNGAGVVANNGGAVVFNGGAAAPGPTKLVADNGLGLIGKTKLVSDNGLGIIANNGSTLVGKSKRRTLDGDAPAPGTALPGAGLEVGVVSLADGKPLPVGVDGQGKPVYAAFTDAAGSYHLYLPAGLAGNVRVVAVAPESDDPRLEYGAVGRADALANVQIDEVSALIAAYLRLRFTRGMEYLLGHDAAIGKVNELAGNPVLAAALAGLADELREALEGAGFQALAPAQKREALQHVADALVARIELDKVVTSSTVRGWKTDGHEQAMGAMAGIVRTMARNAATLLARDPAYFEGRPYLLQLNRARAAAGVPLLHIRRPIDVASFVLGEYLASTDERDFAKLDHVLVDLGIEATERLHFRAAGGGVYIALAGTLVGNPEVKDAVLATAGAAVAAAKAYAPADPATPEPAPALSPAAAPAVNVTTIAGTGAPGFADGAAGAFNYPTGLALDERDPAHPVLYVADNYNHRIRKLAKDAAGWTTTSVAGNGTQGYADGPGAAASFNVPYGLATDGRGHLFVSEFGGHRIRQVDLDDPAHPVSTLAGDGTPGLVEGPGASARFHSPEGLAYDGAGHLLVADYENHRVRQIDLAAPAHPVSTWAGSGAGDYYTKAGSLADIALVNPAAVAVRDGSSYIVDGQWVMRTGPEGVLRLLAGDVAGFADGYWTDGLFGNIRGLAIAPDGRVFVADPDNHRIRQIDAAGNVVTLAGTGSDGAADGPGGAASFHDPWGLALDAAGNMYVCEREGSRIRLLEPTR
jgi:sugar lactone lactonase YvrE